MSLTGHKYIAQTRAYCDYLEEHFTNIEKAYEYIVSACENHEWFQNNFNASVLYNQVLAHDLSKFTAMEFTQYRNRYFSGEDLKNAHKADFKLAWQHHYTNNPHHWQSATTKVDIVHTIIDWTAMGYKFGDTAEEYYQANKSTITLSDELTEFMHTIFKCLKDNQ